MSAKRTASSTFTNTNTGIDNTIIDIEYSRAYSSFTTESSQYDTSHVQQVLHDIIKRLASNNNPTQLQNDLEIILHGMDWIPNDYLEKMLSDLIPIIVQYVKQPNLISYNCRLTILRILNQCTMTESIKTCMPNLIQFFTHVLQEETEELALIVLHTFVDWDKIFKSNMEVFVQPFLSIIQRYYTGINETIKYIFSLKDEGEKSTSKTIPSKHSFRVLTECPMLIVVFLQMHRRWMSENISKFIPILVDALSHDIVSKSAIPSHLSQRHSDYYSAMVKALSLFAYILRCYPTLAKPFQEKIIQSVFQLLHHCPPDAASLRKDLLTAIRHILSTEFRIGFLPRLDDLMNDTLRLCKGAGSLYLKTFVYSMLADFVHHIRPELSPDGLEKSILFFSKAFLSHNLTIHMQGILAKLLMTFVESSNLDIHERKNSILSNVFSTFIIKFQHLHKPINHLSITSTSSAFYIMETCPLPTNSSIGDIIYDPVKELKQLMKNMVASIKSTLLVMRGTSTSTYPEIYHMISLFKNVIQCFVSLPTDKKLSANIPVSIPAISAEDKDLLDQFSYLFTIIPVTLFYDVIASQLDFLIENIYSNPLLLAIPQYFLAIHDISSRFATLLLKHLMSNIEQLGNYPPLKAQITLRLFKLIFLSVSVFPEDNEMVLQPYLGGLILSCLKCSSKVIDNTIEPIHYFYLLRSLFRSIGGGRYEQLYKEVLPLLPTLLDTLNALLASTTSVTMRELFLELSLTIPVRLSVLLPYLPNLMRPLVNSLHAGQELISQGLRTLELCIDNLTQDFLDPILEQVMPDLLEALWSHLKPSPYPTTQSHTAMRILGKLSGRNHRIIHPLRLEYQQSNNDSLALIHNVMIGNELETVQIPLNILIDRLVSIWSKAGNALKEVSFPCIERLFEFMFKCDSNELRDPISKIIQVLFFCASSLPLDMMSQRLTNNNATSTGTSDIMAEKALRLLKTAYDYFVQFDSKNQRILGLADALMFAILNESTNMRMLGKDIMTFILEAISIKYLNSIDQLQDILSRHDIMELFINKACSACYQAEPFQKLGGCIILSLLLNPVHIILEQEHKIFLFNQSWLHDHLLAFARSLLYVLKDGSGPTLVLQLVDQQVKPIFQRLLTLAVENNGSETSKDQLLCLLTSELSNSNVSVRELIQESLVFLSKYCASNVVELLVPYKERIITPIFSKPLRALPFSIQIGYLSAINWCLKQQITTTSILLEWNEELTRLIHEAIALSDAEDQALVGKPTQPNNVVLLNNLRVVCIQLLSTIMMSEFLASPKQLATRNRIVSIFFKSLYSKSDEIVSVSKKSLSQVISSQQKLPKDLLQHGLRPILMNLSDYKRLTISGLEGLGRLLELLTCYFKVEIGRKLLDHLKQWANPAILTSHSDSNELNIIAAILNVFYLLPGAANLFLTETLDTIISIESTIHRSESSPLRNPIVPYLVRYKNDTIRYFLYQRPDLKTARILIDFISIDKSGILYETLLDNLPSFISGSNNLLTSSDSEPPIEKSSQMEIDELQDVQSVKLSDVVISHRILDKVQTIELVIFLIDGISHNIKRKDLVLNIITVLLEFWDRSPNIFHKLFTGFKSENESGTSLSDLASFSPIEAMIRVSQLAISYEHDQQYLILYRIATLTRYASYTGMISDIYSLKEYFKNIEIEKDFILYIINKLNNNYDQTLFSFVSQSIIVPFLESNTSFLSDSLFIDSLCNWLWTKHEDESIILEHIQLTISILNHYIGSDIKSSHLWKKRKQLESFIMQLNLVDPICRQASNVLLSMTIVLGIVDPDAITQSIKSVVQEFLSNSSILEARPIIRKGLEILVPSFPLKYWIPILIKTLSEEPHLNYQVFTIWHIILKFPDLFHPYREHFVPLMMSHLNKTAISLNASTEHKQICVDLINLVWQWESKETKKVFKTPNFMLENFLQTLMKIMISNTTMPTLDNITKPILTPLLTKANQVFNNITSDAKLLNDDMNLIKIELGNSLIFLDRLIGNAFSQVNDLYILIIEQLPTILMTIDWINSWFKDIKNDVILRKIIQKCPNISTLFLNAHPWILYLMHDMLDDMLILDKIESTAAIDRANIFPGINRKIMNSLSSFATTSQPVTASIYSLYTILKRDIILNDSQIAIILKVLSVLVREYTEWIQGKKTPNQSGYGHMLFYGLFEPIQPNNAPMFIGQHSKCSPIQLLISIIMLFKILFSHSHRIYEQKTILLHLVIDCLDTLYNNSLLSLLLDISKAWLGINDTDRILPLTMKEKVQLTTKLFECMKNAVHQVPLPLEHLIVSKLAYTSSSQQRLDIQLHCDILVPIYQSKTYQGTELVFKLQNEFLYAWKHSQSSIRDTLLRLIHESIPLCEMKRICYIFGTQDWSSLSSFYWIQQALELLLLPMMNDINNEDDMILDLIHWIRSDISLSEPLFIYLFIQLWSKIFNTFPTHQVDQIKRDITHCLRQGYHQVDSGVISTLMSCILKCAISHQSFIISSPSLVKFIGKTFKAWHSSILYLELLLNTNSSTREDNAQTCLAELLLQLEEEDVYYGLWKRQCIFAETNVALSLEQHGYYESAQMIYEFVQAKARSGLLPYPIPSQGIDCSRMTHPSNEFQLWEDRWIQSAKKLQQWDILVELAKVDNQIDLSLEGSWRLLDWTLPKDQTALKSALDLLVETPTPRRKLFEAFLALNQQVTGSNTDFSKILEEGYDCLLKEWQSLPNDLHPRMKLLHQFQLYVELFESVPIYHSWSSMMNIHRSNNQQSISLHGPAMMQEVKGIMSTWRERLPNIWADLNIWSELVAWRQHVFSAMNLMYHQTQTIIDVNSTEAPTGTSLAYRGYHETAWIINQFAHVMRKHELPDVCIQLLNKIYTLPNIEIQDAFLKLSEQAKCYLLSARMASDTSNPISVHELTSGLEIINATNLSYFGSSQKAEFFSLKAQFLSRLGLQEEANKIFAQAVQLDLNYADGWAAWGQYNDAKFRQCLLKQDDDSQSMNWAVHAIHCYLQAATLQRPSRTRKLLAHVLWLLSFEDEQETLSKAFELYNNELPIWSWIGFIPQLLTSLTRKKEAKQARFLLVKIAKTFPQALYFTLRATHEEYKKRSSMDEQVIMEANDNLEPTPENISVDSNSTLRQNDWENTEDLLAILKTGYPLLALTLENMVEHIIQRLRPIPDEDFYRIIVTLLDEAYQQQSVMRIDSNSGIDGITSSISKVSEILSNPSHSNHKYKSKFDQDFDQVTSLVQIIKLLLEWKDRLEKNTFRIPKILNLETFSRYLVEFSHQKYEDAIEIPGQYLLLKDSNSDFVKIDRFEPIFSIVHRHGTSYRRIGIIGQDGSIHYFLVQNPSARHARREEKIMHVFNMMNHHLLKRKETRKRELVFSIPIIVPLSCHVRLIQDMPECVSLDQVMEEYLNDKNMSVDDIVQRHHKALTEAMEENDIPMKKASTDVLNLKLELFDDVSDRIVPKTILTRYVMKNISMINTSGDSWGLAYWAFRRQFTRQYAAQIFIQYVLGLGSRFLHRIYFSKVNGNVSMSDMLPILNHQGLYQIGEAVPFRLTPNLQHFMGDIGMEGLLISSIFAIAKCLTERRFEMEDYLALFIRDELAGWIGKSDGEDIISKTLQNVDNIYKRVLLLACTQERSKLGVDSLTENPSFTFSNNDDDKSSTITSTLSPLHQSILDLISCAVNPQKLCQMDSHWHPWM